MTKQPTSKAGEKKRKLTTIALLEMSGKARYLFEDELPPQPERILITKKVADRIKKYLSLMNL